MTTLLYTHPSFLEHDTGFGHPESADRLRSIDASLGTVDFKALQRRKAPLGKEQRIQLVHSRELVSHIVQASNEQRLFYIDGDTVVSPGSWCAALHAVGAVCDAVDSVVSGQASNAFCAVRPPGHHAETNKSMGFCLFNNVAIAAQYARIHCQLKRIAIIDFDVHHGNGTQEIFYREPDVLYASTHQYPFYPGTGSSEETGVGNIVNVPLTAGSGGKEFKTAMLKNIIPALHQFKPQLMLISAGFDAHRDDPLASLDLVEDDFVWVTRELLEIANKYCHGRVISTLEGGYNLQALGSSVAAHICELMNAE